MWSGGGNVSTIEWLVVGLEAMAIETATKTTSVVLTLTPDDDGLDGTVLLCRVTLSIGQEAEEAIILSVFSRYVNEFWRPGATKRRLDARLVVSRDPRNTRQEQLGKH